MTLLSVVFWRSIEVRQIAEAFASTTISESEQDTVAHGGGITVTMGDGNPGGIEIVAGAVAFHQRSSVDMWGKSDSEILTARAEGGEHRAI